jgi:hypothetical protein
MTSGQPTLLGVVAKTVAAHTLTYFAMGLLASTLFSYGSLFAEPALSGYLRPIADRIVMAGPLLQPVRGVLFGLVFYLLRYISQSCRSGFTCAACPK